MWRRDVKEDGWRMGVEEGCEGGWVEDGYGGGM